MTDADRTWYLAMAKRHRKLAGIEGELACGLGLQGAHAQAAHHQAEADRHAQNALTLESLADARLPAEWREGAGA